jgi:hypothetical protein
MLALRLARRRRFGSATASRFLLANRVHAGEGTQSAIHARQIRKAFQQPNVGQADGRANRYRRVEQSHGLQGDAFAAKLPLHSAFRAAQGLRRSGGGKQALAFEHRHHLSYRAAFDTEQPCGRGKRNHARPGPQCASAWCAKQAFTLAMAATIGVLLAVAGRCILLLDAAITAPLLELESGL